MSLFLLLNTNEDILKSDFNFWVEYPFKKLFFYISSPAKTRFYKVNGYSRAELTCIQYFVFVFHIAVK